MSEIKAKSSYTAADIDLLEGLAGVRKRPAMYIGSTNLNGVHHLVWEIIDNAVDEALNGYGETIRITIDVHRLVDFTDVEGVGGDASRGGSGVIHLLDGFLQADLAVELDRHTRLRSHGVRGPGGGTLQGDGNIILASAVDISYSFYFVEIFINSEFLLAPF